MDCGGKKPGYVLCQIVLRMISPFTLPKGFTELAHTGTIQYQQKIKGHIMSKETELQNFTRIVENMITEELTLSINTPALVGWDALSNYLSQRPTIKDFNYSLYAHNKAYSALTVSTGG